MFSSWGSTFISDAVHSVPYLWTSPIILVKPAWTWGSSMNSRDITLRLPSQSGQEPTIMHTSAAPFFAMLVKYRVAFWKDSSEPSTPPPLFVWVRRLFRVMPLMVTGLNICSYKSHTSFLSAAQQATQAAVPHLISRCGQAARFFTQ